MSASPRGTDALARIARSRILPVVVIDEPEAAEAVARVLMSAGVPCAEVALRTPAALPALAAMARVEGFTAGVGTVLDESALDAAVDAGAAFAVSPGLDDGVVRRALERDVPVIPGVATATEAMRALRLGVRHLKLFPAEDLGGVGLLESLRGPFPDIRFLPSGGVTRANALEYLAQPNVFAVSGSWMVPRRLLHRDTLDELGALVAEAKDLVG